MELANTYVSDFKWKHIFDDSSFISNLLDAILPNYINECRWFGGKASTIKKISIDNVMPLDLEDQRIYILILEVLFTENFVQHYFLPIGISNQRLEETYDKGNVHPIELSGQKYYIVDALYLSVFRNFLFNGIVKKSKYSNNNSSLVFQKSKSLKSKNGQIQSYLLKADQSNTSIIFNDNYFMKVFRRMFRDPNPDLEMVHFLSEEQHFKNTPKYAGSVTWKINNAYEVSLALMQEKVENQGDAWNWMLNHLLQFFQNVNDKNIKSDNLPHIKLYELKKLKKIQKLWFELLEKECLLGIRKLAKRTAQMHLKLFSNQESTTFCPVFYNPDYTVWLKNRLIYQFEARYNLVERNLHLLSGLTREYAEKFLQKKTEIIAKILDFDETKLSSQRIRIHGDYHLGQILICGEDFFILDFEGEPESTIRDRKVKQSPLKDVSGLLRSFHYAIYATIFNHSDKWSMERNELFAIGEKLYRMILSVFLQTYVRIAFTNRLDIGYKPEIEFLLNYNLLEKAIYELGYEMNGRPSWAIIPLTGIMQLLKEESTGTYE